MIKKVFILAIMLVGILTMASYGQGAQATMRVSVRVVSGSSVEMNQPSAVILRTNQKSSLGMLTLKGINKEDVLISSSPMVKLSDTKGNEMILNISTKESFGQDQETISYEGTSVRQGMVSSVYKGELTTTIEYF